jgi:hypothetical protein
MMGEREGYAEQERAIELLFESGASSYAATAKHNLAVAIWERDGPAAALPKMTEARRFGRERGIGLAATSAVIESGFLATVGRLDESLSVMSSIRGELESTGQVQSLLRTDETAALIYLARGMRREAADSAAAALAAARQLGDHRSLAMALRPAIGAEVITADQASASLRQLAGDRVLREDHDFVARLPDFVDEAVKLGEVTLARQLVDGVSPQNPLYERCLAQAAARLVEADGENLTAARLFADAVAGWRGWGATWHLADSLLGRGRCLLAAGEPDAADALREARAVYEQMGASARVVECDELMDQAAT